MSSPRTPWTENSYGRITGEGARKLAASGVAPLIAIARGYWTARDKDGARELAALSTSVAVTPLALQRQLGALVAGDEDILVMPWHQVADVAERGLASRSRNTQYRPSRPRVTTEGKTIKYEFFQGEGTTIDVHPSTPARWLTHGMRVVLAEGLIKGDAALTGLLLGSGKVTADELSETWTEVADARARLQELMARIPDFTATLIVNTASVTTWEGHAEQWKAVRFDDREVILAFDGDLASNYRVHRQVTKAMEFFRRGKGKPRILGMFGKEFEQLCSDAGFDDPSKIGVDDFLAYVGGWRQLLGLATDRLPVEPASEADAVLGQWRIDPANSWRLQEYAKGVDGGAPRWFDRAPVGGSIVGTATTRRPTWDEIEDGIVDEELDAASAAVGRFELDVRIADAAAPDDAAYETYRVSGPAHLLMAPTPASWALAAQRSEMHLPTQLLAHEEWPPREWQGWLRAVRANASGEHARTWEVLGWVPGEDGGAFVLPGQTLAEGAQTEGAVRTSVRGAGVSRLGVADPYRSLSPNAYRTRVAAAIERTVDAYATLFNDPTAGAIALTAGLRPTVPLPSAVIVLIEGEQSGGKTFAASWVCAPWRGDRRLARMQNLVLGTADDTAAATEVAVAEHLLWTMDDVAPDVDERRSTARQSTTATVARRIFNGAARKRMGTSNVPDARAVLLITAENAIPGQSFRARVWPIAVEKGKTYNESVLEDLQAMMGADGETDLGVAAGSLIRRFTNRDHGERWTDAVAHADQLRRRLADRAVEELRAAGVDASAAARQGGKVADLAIVLELLRERLVWAHGGELSSGGLRALSALDGMWNALIGSATENAATQAQSNPGLVTLIGVHRALQAGAAHLTNAVDPYKPPFLDAQMCAAAGWQYVAGEWRPRGVAIGKVGTRAPEGDVIALLADQAAFREAQKISPEILPGMLAHDSWAAAGAAGLLIDPPAAAGRKRTTRVSFVRDEGASLRASGVAVAWDLLLAPALPVAAIEGEDSDAAAAA